MYPYMYINVTESREQVLCSSAHVDKTTAAMLNAEANMCTETAENATGAQGRDRVFLKIR